MGEALIARRGGGGSGKKVIVGSVAAGGNNGVAITFPLTDVPLPRGHIHSRCCLQPLYRVPYHR